MNEAAAAHSCALLITPTQLQKCLVSGKEEDGVGKPCTQQTPTKLLTNTKEVLAARRDKPV